jgi:phosphoribosyl 1,2-cyclic phosphodiesterase
VRFSVLGSGSKGNCTLVEAGSTRLLIDNGFSCKELVARLRGLGIDPETLTGLVVTHEHDDHVKGVGVAARRLNLPIYANVATHRASEHRVGRVPVLREFATGEPFTINDLLIHPFAVSHDTADPVGFTVSNGVSCLGYCTDTGKITHLIRHHLEKCHALVLEANHDVRMLQDGPYPLPLKQRVLSIRGHLANGESLEFAGRLAQGRLRCLVLAHLSEINNLPELVLQEAHRRLPSCEGLQVLIAEQLRVSPLLNIDP